MQKINRGIQILSKVFDDVGNNSNNNKEFKGSFKTERNKCLVYRYYYHYELQQKRFDVAIELIASEFFLNKTTVSSLLSNCTDMLKDVISEAPTVRDLKLKYQFLNW